MNGKDEEKHVTANLPAAPQGTQRIKWLGPAFVWMLSAAGSGELLFTPLIASQYGYALLWALLLAVAMKWCINREVGRYTVCTGATFFSGVGALSAGKWLTGFLVIPQLVVAVATVAGLAGAAATAVHVLFQNMSLQIAAVAMVIIYAFIILSGGYRVIDKVMTTLGIVVSLSVLAAAFSTGPDLEKISEGFRFTVPANVNTDEVMSWLGFMLAGAAGLMWFSYWVAARGYGAAGADVQPKDLRKISDEEKKQLRLWIKQITIANTLAVCGALVIAVAFLILGAELLQPKGLVPKENEVAQTLGQLLGGIWGKTGFWFMIIAMFITFSGTMLADQDGFARMFSDGFRTMARDWNLAEKYREPAFLKKLFVIVVLAIVPLLTYLFVGNPVQLLKLAGIIEACHIPVVTFTVLYLNVNTLPSLLRPGRVSIFMTALSGLSFAAFAVVFLVEYL